MKWGVVVVALLCVSLVFAAGSSTKKTMPVPEPEATPPEEPDCESLDALTSRIQCRLHNDIEEDGTPEACTAASSPAACTQLYRDVYPCYDVPGSERYACFQDVSDDTRDTILFLLYDLQERVEEAFEDGEIGANPAAGLIASIVEIKQDVLSGAATSELRASVAELRTAWERDM